MHSSGTAINSSGTAINSSGTAIDVRSMASEPFGTTFSSSESDEGLNETGMHPSGTVIGSR